MLCRYGENSPLCIRAPAEYSYSIDEIELKLIAVIVTVFSMS